jgi:thiamine-phosphate pyrophosphorylase
MSQQIDFKLYLITDSKIFCTSGDFFRAVEDALKAGVRAVQLREKDLPTRDLLEMARIFRELTRRYGARLFINDRLDIALIAEADGVHLGNASIPVSVVRSVVGDRLLIGSSTHSVKDASEAAEGGADFITFGPVFQTPSKAQFGEPVGLEPMRETSAKVSIPIFGLGGIKKENIRHVLDYGASGVALISGILAAADVGSTAGAYLKEAGETV